MLRYKLRVFVSRFSQPSSRGEGGGSFPGLAFRNKELLTFPSIIKHVNRAKSSAWTSRKFSPLSPYNTVLFLKCSYRRKISKFYSTGTCLQVELQNPSSVKTGEINVPYRACFPLWATCLSISGYGTTFLWCVSL